jgi:hypothetical protein
MNANGRRSFHPICVHQRLSLSVRPLLSSQAFVRMYIILKFARQIRKEAGKNLSRICNKGWVRGVVLAACSLDGRGRDLGVLSQRREGEDGRENAAACCGRLSCGFRRGSAGQRLKSRLSSEHPNRRLVMGCMLVVAPRLVNRCSGILLAVVYSSRFSVMKRR